MGKSIINKSISSMNNAYNVQGKNVIVTGGNRGIGLGIATAFAQSGANVGIICRDQASGIAAVDSFSEYGGKYKYFCCDISDFNEAKSATCELTDFFGRIDVLINNAGVATTTDLLDTEKGLSEWRRVIDVNLHGTANVLHFIAPGMRDSGLGGCIINISSVGALRVSGSKEHHNPPYNVSKAGIDILTRYLAVTLGDYGIRVNAIQPGPTHSELEKDLPSAFIKMITEDLPAHRFGEPLEIGALAVFLASPAAAMITGACIPCDGGLLTIR